MKTDDLIAMLSSGPDVPVTGSASGPVARFLLGGLASSFALMLVLLGVRHDLIQAAALPAFWLKVLFAVALAWAGWLAAKRLATPGARLAMAPVYLGVPVLVMWAIAAAMLWHATPDEAAVLFWGGTWRVCPFLIALLSLPVLVAAMQAMRALAPTRLRLAGAAAGFAAGASATAVYCLHCPEMSPVFVGFWYLVGIMISTLLGALAGPRALAW